MSNITHLLSNNRLGKSRPLLPGLAEAAAEVMRLVPLILFHGVQVRQEEFFHHAGVGFAARNLHNLTHQKTQFADVLPAR